MKQIIPLVLLLAIAGSLLVYSRHRPEPQVVSGTIEAHEIRVGSRVGGRVAEVTVEEGQQVIKGDVLLRLEPFNLLEKREEAIATLAAATADLTRLEHGFRDEEIGQAQARRDQLSAMLQKLTAGPRPQEIKAAVAQLELTKTQLLLAQQNHARIQRVFTSNAVTQDELDRAVQELRGAESRVAVRSEELALLNEGTRQEEIAEAQAKLDEANHALELKKRGYRPEEIAQASATRDAANAVLAAIARRIEELTVKAPVDGVIEAVELRPGDLVSPNAPVLSLLDTSQLWMRAYIPENRLDLKIGQRVRITVDSFKGQDFHGEVTFIPRQAEFTPSNVQTIEERSKQVFRIKITLLDGLDSLRPGMAGDIWLDSVSDSGAADSDASHPSTDSK